MYDEKRSGAEVITEGWRKDLHALKIRLAGPLQTAGPRDISEKEKHPFKILSLHIPTTQFLLHNIPYHPPTLRTSSPITRTIHRHCPVSHRSLHAITARYLRRAFEPRRLRLRHYLDSTITSNHTHNEGLLKHIAFRLRLGTRLDRKLAKILALE